ncbi:MAG: GH116 family glycosyl-hydrolase [Caldivirga sp.]
MDVSGRELNSGMPLGGIGAGAIEFFPDLTIGNVTIMNNWLNPIKVVRGFHVVLLEDEPLFLQLNPGKHVEVKPRYRHVDRINVEAQYPRIRYVFTGLPISEVEFYTPIVKGNVKDSSLPLIVARVRAVSVFMVVCGVYFSLMAKSRLDL